MQRVSRSLRRGLWRVSSVSCQELKVHLVCFYHNCNTSVHIYKYIDMSLYGYARVDQFSAGGTEIFIVVLNKTFP